MSLSEYITAEFGIVPDEVQLEQIREIVVIETGRLFLEKHGFGDLQKLEFDEPRHIRLSNGIGPVIDIYSPKSIYIEPNNKDIK